MKKLGFMQVLLPLLLIIAGTGYLSWVNDSEAQRVIQFSPLSVNTVSESSQPDSQIAQQPRSLQIPRLQRTLFVQKGTYNPSSQSWTLDSRHAFFMSEAATPLLYGHATPLVFGGLRHLQPGDELLVDTGNGWQTFSFTDKWVINPKDTAILQEKYNQSILLMTCSGLFSQSREIFHFTQKAGK